MKVWSEKNGRADVVVHGFSLADYAMTLLAGFIVLGACIWSLAVLS